MDFFGIYWHASHRFWLFPFIVLAIILLIKNYRNIKAASKTLVAIAHRKDVFQHFSHLRQFLKLLASCGALLFLFIALLQPQWNKKEQAIEQEGRDVLILLDVSRSMLAQDLKPNRLEAIKFKLKTLLQKLPFERVGLILFSGSAFVQCPLTVDYPTFAMFLDQVDVESISSGTTAIDSALQKAIELYKRYPGRKNKLALLITDGEDFSLNLESIKEEAKREEIKILALGAGTPQGAPIPKIDINGKQTGHEVDANGNIVLSKLNEELLKNICTSLGDVHLPGNYVQTTYDDSDLDYLVQIIEKFEKEKFSDKRLSLYEDHYPWFLGISWVMFLLEWVL